jgi:hypothetical protein
LAVWKVPRQCPLVLLIKDLINFEFKDVGAAVVGEMESNFGRAILSCLLFETQLNSMDLSVPHRKHFKLPLRAQQVNAINRFVMMVY